MSKLLTTLSLSLEESVARLRRVGWQGDVHVVTDATQTHEDATVEILIATSHRIDAATLGRWPALRMVSCAFTGHEEVDKDECRARGIAVYYVPDYSKHSVAELAVALVLTLYRRIREADSRIRQGLWDRDIVPGIELYGKTVGILGTGRIGCEAARRFAAFGCRVTGFSHSDAADFMESGGVYCGSVDELLAVSDIVSLHLPLNAETRHCIGQRELALMKPSAILINASRSGLVDGAALVNALNEGRLLGAGIDVFDSEPVSEDDGLLHVDGNVVLTPHIGFKTHEALDRLAHVAIENVGRYLSNDSTNRLV